MAARHTAFDLRRCRLRGPRRAARALGLDFIPLLPERYDLVVPESTFKDPRFQTLLAVIRSPAFKDAAQTLGGYDLQDCGKILWEQ